MHRKPMDRIYSNSLSTVILLLLSTLIPPLHSRSTQKLYIVYMGDKHHEDPDVVMALHHDVLHSIVGSKEAARKSLVYSYKHGFSGFAAMLTHSQAKHIAEKKGVIRVSLSHNYRIQTTRSWNFLGMDLDDPSGLLRDARGGEDVIIGMIDTGIWPESRSFNDDDYGQIPSRWKGKCDSRTTANSSFPFRCNRKIIGARWYAGGVDAKELKGEFASPRDMNGHGTHTASTAAGCMVRNVSFHGMAAGATRGGAPRARIAVYKSLWGASGTGNEATVLAAIDDAIHDGVDVLSMSLAAIDDMSFSIASLHAVARGITVVLAAGNGGPMPMTVTNASPWVITVAASTIDRAFPTEILLGNNLTLIGQALYQRTKRDRSIIGVGYKNLALASRVHATPSNDFEFVVPYMTEDLQRANIRGKVVLCPSSGSSTPQAYIVDRTAFDVVRLGGRGVVVAQYSMNTLEMSDACAVVPCVLVDFDVGTRMADYIIRTRRPIVVRIKPTVTIVGSQIPSPKVAGFSSRGPNVFIPGVIKPDIAAPGVNILGAKGDGYVLDSGTSMATPHITGVVALLKSLHPNWSPAAMKSALITTARTTDRYGFPMMAEGLPRKTANPFDYGGGQVKPNDAATPGLVYDMNADDYQSFVRCRMEDTSGGFCTPTAKQGYHMNLPSISIPNLKKNSITVSRTLTSVEETNATYRVTFLSPPGVKIIVRPRTLSFTPASRVRTYHVTFSSLRNIQGDYQFGSLTWTSEKRFVRIPLAVRAVLNDFYSDVS